MSTSAAAKKSQSIEQLSINTIRTLAMDAVQAADSGHPGTPMALAPITYQLWAERLVYDPAQPLWPNRDRYILSCGHASMLLYAMIHLAGVRHASRDGEVADEPAISLDQIKNFRQWGSRTPGHPEYGHATGVETTTGPLGQGCGNSVGMALAGRWLAARYNKPGFPVFNFNVFVQCSDGDLMEGVACEAASLAGHLALPNLCWIYDDNKITIEGATDLAFSEDVPVRFHGLGWKVVTVQDANDREAFAKALATFDATKDKPTLIAVRSVIAWGAPNAAGTSAAHGAPLGEEEVRLTKRAYGWPEDKKFHVPQEVPEHFEATLGTRGASAFGQWSEMFTRYRKGHPQLAAEIDQIVRGELPAGWDEGLPQFEASEKGMATRRSSGDVLNAIAPRVPWLIGGSADLAPSTNTLVKGGGDFSAKDFAGRNLHFGVREHGMAAAANGMALCGLRPYAATFFVFTDYLRPSMRLAALIGLPVIYVFTHDSVGLGEDGPTHQPIEHLSAVRAIPNIIVLRPADANEVREAWKIALTSKDRPVALILSRQNVPTIDRKRYAAADGTGQGGYILADSKKGAPSVILMSTGSEVSLALAAYESLQKEGVAARVVSLPSFELFDGQPQTYQDQVLPPEVTARVAVEAGVRQSWDRYLGPGGRFVGLDRFGASAPYATAFAKLGLTTENIVEAAKAAMAR
jgi:transketolase